MDRIEYFEELRETSKTVKPIIEKYSTTFYQRYEGIYRSIFYLTSERIKKNIFLLKPFLVRLSYELTGGKNWERIAPICAAAELINISSYQANLSFDGKYGLATQDDKSNQFIASMITREMVANIVHDMIELISYGQAEKIAHSFAESNKFIYVGQYYDLNVLRLKSFDLSNDFSSYLKLYIERCDYLSGVFSEECAFIGGVLSGARDEELSALRAFGRNFGIGLHIVNDIGDLVPSSMIKVSRLKKRYDQYSDIKHGKLTLPIMHFLKYGDEVQKKRMLEILGNSKISESDLFEITRILIISGSISFSKKLAKDYMKKAKNALRLFDASHARSLLSVMTSQLRSNKYFATLRRFANG
jgi:geranylgeranyl pyrophosphate synthase